MIFFLRWIYLH